MFSAVSRFFKSAATDAPYLSDLIEWIGSVQSGALDRWLPVALRSFPCADENTREGRCPRTAVAICETCGRTVCIQHAFVGRTAQVVCVRCVAGMKSGQRVEKQPPQRQGIDPKIIEHQQLTKKHFKALSLRSTATFGQAKARYKELALKHHVDRGGDIERIKEINVAFEWLKQNHYRH